MDHIGLAEPKKKGRWTLNPRGTLWAKDKNKVGQRLLEKMGWEQGKGLGKDEQGIQEPIRTVSNQESRGMGYDGNKDEWVAHYDAFENVLADLNKATNKGTPNENSDPNCETEKQTESLELLSKNSKNRVHYKKFTRGKDVSRYSEDDLACILGSKKSSRKSSTPVVDERPKEEEKLEVGEVDKSFGLTSVHGGSLKDYFSHKMEELKKKREAGLLGSNVNENSEQDTRDKGFSPSITPLPDLEFEPAKTNFSFNLGVEEQQEDQVENGNYLDIVEDCKKSKKKKKKKDKVAVEESEKRPKKDKMVGEEESGNVEVNEPCEQVLKVKKKKSKKKKNNDDVDNEVCEKDVSLEQNENKQNGELGVECETGDGSNIKKKRKIKIEVLNTEETKEYDTESISRKKKKKKKEKEVGNEDHTNDDNMDEKWCIENEIKEEDATKENEENEEKELKQSEMNMSYFAATCMDEKKRKKKKRDKGDVDSIAQGEKPLKRLKKLASELSLVDIFKGNARDESESHSIDGSVLDGPPASDEKQESNQNVVDVGELDVPLKPKKKLKSKNSFKELKTQIECKFKKKSKKGLDSIEETMEDNDMLQKSNDTSDIVTLSVPQRHLKDNSKNPGKCPVKDITCNIQELYPGSNIASVKGYNT